jgi:hypothetical protein
MMCLVRRFVLALSSVLSPPLLHPNKLTRVPEQQEPRYHASWGWDYIGNFTVLTIVHEPSQEEAFFGYSHPNDGLPVASYPDQGPKATQHT